MRELHFPGGRVLAPKSRVTNFVHAFRVHRFDSRRAGTCLCKQMGSNIVGRLLPVHAFPVKLSCLSVWKTGPPCTCELSRNPHKSDPIDVDCNFLYSSSELLSVPLYSDFSGQTTKSVTNDTTLVSNAFLRPPGNPSSGLHQAPSSSSSDTKATPPPHPS
jgi:hypothetical protein